MNQFVMIAGFAIILIACQVSAQDQFYGKQEPACIRKGGLCIQKSECENYIGGEGELCPQQAAQGFQCCFGLPKSETRCQRHGGECFKKGFCNQRFVYTEASNCAADQDCCILL